MESLEPLVRSFSKIARCGQVKSARENATLSSTCRRAAANEFELPPLGAARLRIASHDLSARLRFFVVRFLELRRRELVFNRR